MRINALFLALTIIIVVIIILTFDSLIAVLALVGLILNYAVISGKSNATASINAINWGVPGGIGGGDSEDIDGDKRGDNHDSEAKSMAPPTAALLKQSLIDTLPPVIQRNWNRGVPGKDDQNTNLYGQDQYEYDNYINAYSECYDPPSAVVMRSCSEADGTMDTANVRIAQQRGRDKKCMDGFVSKMSNPHFMRHHYAGELDAEENKAWWGRGEY